ncbi:protein AATF [Lethenteron reissneri]|uniref:protein AATF n=1 Tax=Lethenteron reissneri TaxID=7753 RepID=UPI002AB733D2|nr:protein AATF [Lethenteron reissneri]
MSLSESLSALLNPTPRAVDPEDADTGCCGARLAERFAQNEEDEVGPSVLRRRAALAESDARYRGLIATRQDLHLLGDHHDEDDDDDGSDDASSVGAASEVQVEAEEQEEGPAAITSATWEHARPGEQQLQEDDDENESPGDDDDDDDADGNVMDEEEEVTSEEEGLLQGGLHKPENGGVVTFQSEEIDEEVGKGQAIKRQIGLWDHLLEARIKMQRALEICNRLPQPDTLPGFKARSGDALSRTLGESRSVLLEQMRLLTDLQNHLLHSNADTQHMVDRSSLHNWEEQPGSAALPQGGRVPSKRSLLMDEYPDFSAKRFTAYKHHRNAVIQKWHDKTKLSGGKMKGFASFDRSVLLQIEHVLQERERLLLRTQTKRSAFTILGKTPNEETSGSGMGTDESHPAVAPRAASQLKDIDPEVFDDGDFYHQLLRELIECKTAATDSNDQLAWGRQWLEIQKLRSKVKKKVDTKASKGRKIRYNVHSKLLSFMAPVDNSCMSDEARTELFRSLFGKSQKLEPSPAV